MTKRQQDEDSNRERSLHLLSAYGPLLTARQRTLMEQHVVTRRSFADIGREYGVSRQAVHDAVRKAQAVLESYDTRLGSLQGLATGRGGELDAIRERLDDLRKRVAGSGIIYRSDWIVREISGVLEMLPDTLPNGDGR